MLFYAYLTAHQLAKQARLIGLASSHTGLAQAYLAVANKGYGKYLSSHQQAFLGHAICSRAFFIFIFRMTFFTVLTVTVFRLNFRFLFSILAFTQFYKDQSSNNLEAHLQSTVNQKSMLYSNFLNTKLQPINPQHECNGLTGKIEQDYFLTFISQKKLM